MSEKDTKLLWGRSGNRCAICKSELSLNTQSTVGTLIGEMAHIVGKIKDGKKSPRSKSLLTEDDRDKYSNLILLCRNDHKIVDDAPEDYPIEVLHRIKSDHEIWVQEKLADCSDINRQAANTVYTHLIDSATTLLQMNKWNLWVDLAGNHSPSWQEDFRANIFEFERRVRAACWPTDKNRINSLEFALKTLAFTSFSAWTTFSKHGKNDGNGWYRSDMFYKFPYPNPNYDSDLNKYEVWEEELFNNFIEFCKSANWFSDEVRKNVNPMFFIEHGKFMFNNRVFEFTSAEISNLVK